LGRQDLDKATAEQIEFIRLIDVAIEADRVELRQHVDLIEPAVQAVRNGNVDQAVFARQRDSRFRPQLGQGIQASSFAAAEHERDDVAHGLCCAQTEEEM